mgnify:CR=1 FL=1
MIKKFKKGFSLVELLVVIAIIGILAAVGITAYSGYTADAKVKASTAQHAQVVSLLNAEMARCASGKGRFIWWVAGNDDDCNDAVRTASVVTYFSLTGKVPLKNPYKDDSASVDTRLGAGGTAAHLTAAGLTEEVTYLGRIAVFCGDDAAMGVNLICIVKSETGEQDPPGNLVAIIKSY